MGFEKIAAAINNICAGSSQTNKRFAESAGYINFMY